MTTSAAEIVAVDGHRVTLRIDCSGGFYVRSLADDLGRALGTGAHLTALRRTRSSGYSLADAVAFADLVDPATGRAAAAAALVPLVEMLPDLPRVVLAPAGAVRAVRGQPIGPADVVGHFPVAPPAGARFRLIAPPGDLLGIGEPTTHGLLHPVVVLK